MQTFLPLSSIVESLNCLDKKRCWKQCIEARQLLDGKAPKHPAAEMWSGFHPALTLYYNTCLGICLVKHRIRTQLTRRRLCGCNESAMLRVCPACAQQDDTPPLPPWFGGKLHSNHRARLLTKDFAHYSQFGWSEAFCIVNYWPSRDPEYADKS